jgi:tight adherence protein C
MNFLFNLLLILAGILGIFLLFKLLQRGRRQIRERLLRVREIENDDEAMLDKAFSERVLKPAGQALAKRLLVFKPSELNRFMQRQLIYADHPWGLTGKKLFGLMILLGLILPSLLYIMARVAVKDAEVGLIQFLLMALAGLLLPYAMVKLRVAKRQEEITRSMPAMLDLLLISIEAGMSLDMALKRTTEALREPLKTELTRFQEEIQVGRSRSEALKAMVERTGVEDLWLFTISVIQAEQRWGNIAEALERQALFLRKKMRRRAEEEARKAPVKMLFPLVFLVFPAMYIVLLGPAMLRVYKIVADLF